MIRSILQLVLPFGIFLGVFPLHSQIVKNMKGEYQMRVERDVSEEEACHECRIQARINAIEKAFGTAVIQGNTTYVENVQTGDRVETTQIFNSIAETMVNGEWLRTLSEPPCEFFDYRGERWVKSVVKGEIGKLQEPKIELEIVTLDCEDLTCATESFKEGESLFLYVKSPVSGYLTVYLTDREVAQRLLPYSNMPDGLESAIPIRADEGFFLFSRRKNTLELDPWLIDEYELYTHKPQDHNRLYIIYSEEPLKKPSLTEGENEENNPAVKGPMPNELPAEDFHKWLAKSWKYNRGKGMQVDRVDILISKSN